MSFVESFFEILKRPTIWAVIVGMIEFVGPVWIAFIFGVIVGWIWRPSWGDRLGNCKFEFSAPSSPIKGFCANKYLDFNRIRFQNFGSSSMGNGSEKERIESTPVENDSCSSSESRKDDIIIPVMDEDLGHLCHLVERKDGGPPWKHMMDRSTQNMSYQAWQRDSGTGPPQYCSRTVYEDATPELLRDFFWDDEFRLNWDDMLLHAKILEECPNTGALLVHWIRKFPFFCSDREYTIARRIWESGRSYYCVTKGVPCLSIPKRDKPRRVDLYYSSWYIQAVESRNGTGQLSACEVILFHHEDMGIPWEIAKLGVRQGMWGAVKNIERGVRSYQKFRSTNAPISHHAFMAQVNTKVDQEYLNVLEGDQELCGETKLVDSSEEEKAKGGVDLAKMLIFGGAVAVALSLDRGLFTKTLIFGVARRFGNIGRRGVPRTN